MASPAADPAPTSRRDFLAWAGATWLLVDPGQLRTALDYAHRAMRQSPVPQFQVLTPDEARELEAIAARIIPTDDAPGAREAGVIHFLDRALATFAQDQVPVVRAGLADLGSRVTERRSDARFSDLPPEEQDELLHVIEQSRFFGSVRFATIVGTFANPSWGGNRDQVGWALLGHEMRPAFEPPFGAYDAEANRVGNR